MLFSWKAATLKLSKGLDLTCDQKILLPNASLGRIKIVAFVPAMYSFTLFNQNGMQADGCIGPSNKIKKMKKIRNI